MGTIPALHSSSFTSWQTQKDFARAKLGQLEYSVQNYNIGSPIGQNLDQAA